MSIYFLTFYKNNPYSYNLTLEYSNVVWYYSRNGGITMNYADRIKELRKANGYTQITLAEALGVSKGTVAMWETGKRTPGYEVINLLSDMFDRRIDYILGYSDDETSPNPSEEEIVQLGQWNIKKRQQEAIDMFLALDSYGRNAVEQLIRNEYLRCEEQGVLI